MKEMIYNGSGKTELLYVEWNSHGQALAVVNTRGSHPCGYIQFPQLDEIENYDGFWIGSDEDGDYCDVHGDWTFLGSLETLGLPGIWLGWDYAHYGDWTQSMPPEQDFFSHEDERKWTTEEIVETAKKCLDYIWNGKYTIEKSE